MSRLQEIKSADREWQANFRKYATREYVAGQANTMASLSLEQGDVFTFNGNTYEIIRAEKGWNKTENCRVYRVTGFVEGVE